VLLPGSGCLVRREFAGGTLVRVSTREGRGLIAVSTALETTAPMSCRMSLIVNGERRPFAGQDVLGRGGWAMAFESSFIPILSAASALDVHGSDGVLVKRLDLDGLEAALARLPACTAEAGAPTLQAGSPAPPPPPMSARGKQRPARAQANLASLFSSDDYPEAAWRAGEEGAVGFRLNIGKAGRVVTCGVTISSGSAELDGATCRLLTERAGFTPARDRKGRLTEASVAGRIVWRIPDPEPPPSPP
jgi:TonB family protein